MKGRRTSAAARPPPVDRSRNDVRMDGVWFCRAIAGGDFAKALEPGNFSYCVMVRTGRARLTTDFPTPTAVDLAWTLPDLAKAAGMSRTRFVDAFKVVTGQSPGHSIARLRLTAIAHRPASEPLSVEAAADEAGYSSSAAFVRAFQRAFGETPARWRRQRRGHEAAGQRPAAQPAPSFDRDRSLPN